MPVLVYIHGGGWNGGTGSARDGASLAGGHDMVVIMINYRLAALGFLGLPGLDAEGGPGAASGNYAILHVGGETFEIRSSLAKLEGELDPGRFVRVHKSHIVNIARVAEVTPWVSGDWRIRLQDGAELNLSRRYRQRFEALAPVRS